jgi:teichuronic acid biosynthesis glycosyltransferase TuaC
MKVLVVVPDYPSAERPMGGSFNARSVLVLKDLCEAIEVLVPRPYAPLLMSTLARRWQAYASIPAYEAYQGVAIHRPAFLQLPRVGSAFCTNYLAAWCCRHVATRLHRRTVFDAIISFDLAGAGGVAWRLGRYLGLPVVGWSTGSDVRHPPMSPYGRAVTQTLRRLDVVFYQSAELLAKAAELLGTTPEHLAPTRHIVLPRGVSPPPLLPRQQVRRQIRQELGLTDAHVIVCSIGRIGRAKGTFELLDAMSIAAARDPRLVCIIVGARPAFDESRAVQQQVDANTSLRERVRIFPACHPDKVWEYLCAADIFAFTSHREGMPNSLLEAMIVGVPAVAFAIPPVVDIAGAAGALVLIPPFHTACFAEALVTLASSPSQQSQLRRLGQERVKEEFHTQKNMEKMLSYLGTIIKNRKGGVL